MDEESDFYNTPWNAGTPLPAAQTAPELAPAPQNGMPLTPLDNQLRIPGLSFLDEGSDSTKGDHLNTAFDDDSNQICTALGQLLPDTANDAESCVLSLEPEPPFDLPKGPISAAGDLEIKDASPVHKKDAEAREATDVSSLENGQTKMTTSRNQLTEYKTLLLARNAVEDREIQLPVEFPAMEGVTEENEEPEWEVDSSPYESSKSSADSSSDETDESDEEYELLSPEEQARILMAAERGSDDELDGDGLKAREEPLRTTNEKPEEIIPKPDIIITAETKVEMLGNVETIVDNVVLIRANISGEYQVLDTGSVLCLANLAVIGVVSETLGRVEQPMYTVRFSSAASVKEHGIEKESPVFYVVEHSKFVFTQPLQGLKGSDASNVHDEEVAEEEIEFSDDEKETEYKQQLKLKRKQKKGGRINPAFSENEGSRFVDQQSPSGALNYDDVDADDGYIRLPRPQNFHELVLPREAPAEAVEAQNHAGQAGWRGRTRGRGNHRGRGRGGRVERGRGRMHSVQGHGKTQYFQDQAPPSPGYHATASQGSPRQYPHLSPNSFSRQALPSFSPSRSLYQPSQPEVPPHQVYAASQISPPSAPSISASESYYPRQQHALEQPRPPFPFQYPPPGSFVNPRFFGSLQQQPPHHNPPQMSAEAGQASEATFAAAQAQLDLLRRLGHGNG